MWATKWCGARRARAACQPNTVWRWIGTRLDLLLAWPAVAGEGAGSMSGGKAFGRKPGGKAEPARSVWKISIVHVQFIRTHRMPFPPGADSDPDSFGAACWGGWKVR